MEILFYWVEINIPGLLLMHAEHYCGLCQDIYVEVTGYYFGIVSTGYNFCIRG